MKLSNDELMWINERMKIYDIKFQEIYNEILDHIITAIEEKRTNGDKRDILEVFQNVVDDHFGGYVGIENLSLEQEKIYLKSVKTAWMRSFKYYLNWPMLAFTVAAVLLSFQLPNVKFVRAFLLVGIFLLAFSPMVYAQIALAGKFRTIKGKKSILKGHLLTRTMIPATVLNSMIYMPQFFFIWNDNENYWSNFKHIPVAFFVPVLMLFVLLNLTAIRYCKEVIAAKSLL
ncbi:hypothetical protein SAMN05216464_102138 [Mucilaginibacter pineti]|uniref:Uncharacterized protein n=1 Tax=Mucilaginibacter pineti TaxID=1391627 RepID=A0A1G6WEP9_9SPHI|nr:hypothetical protein [Mucilaginibacter pineti]SDD63717.1 hypothetical protein SAMN05216464_102138 [Mucilaginibacter pineti]